MNLAPRHVCSAHFAAAVAATAFLLLPSSVMGQSSRRGGSLRGNVQIGNNNVLRGRGDLSGNVQIGSGNVRIGGSLQDNVQIGSSAPIPVSQEYKAGDTVVVLKDAPLRIPGKTVATASKGEKLTVENVEDDWIWVRRNDVSGWVKRTYVLGPTAPARTGEDEDADLGDKYTVSVKYYIITNRSATLVRKLRDDFGVGAGTRPSVAEPRAKPPQESERSRQQMEEHRKEMERYQEGIEAMKAKMDELREKMRNTRDLETIRALSAEMRRVADSARYRPMESDDRTIPTRPGSSGKSAGGSTPQVQEKTPHSAKAIEAFESETPNLQGKFVVDSGVRSGEVIRLSNRDFAVQYELKKDSGSDSNVVLWLVLKELGGGSSPLVIEFPPQTLLLGRPAFQADMNLGSRPSGFACIVEVNK